MKRKFSKFISAATAIAAIVSLLSTMIPARAAELTSIKDTMSRLRMNTKADHAMEFTLPSGVTFDAGDELRYTFPSDFALAGTWVAGDFNFNDGTARAIFGVSQGTGSQLPDCTGSSGANDVAVSASTDTRVFRVRACPSYAASAVAATATFTIDGTDTDGTLTNATTSGSKTITLGHHDEGSLAVTNGGSLAVTIVDVDQVSVTAVVSPSLVFDIDTAPSDTETAAPYSVPLGTLSTAAVTSTNNTTESGTDINGIWVDVGTNAANGVNITVRGANGANGIISASVPSDNINSATGTVTAGSENYGVCVTSSGTGTPTQSSGATLSAAAPFNGSCTDTAHAVGGVTTSPQTILSATGVISGGRAEIRVKAAIGGVIPAHADFGETLTFVATATF